MMICTPFKSEKTVVLAYRSLYNIPTQIAKDIFSFCAGRRSFRLAWQEMGRGGKRNKYAGFPVTKFNHNILRLLLAFEHKI